MDAPLNSGSIPNFGSNLCFNCSPSIEVKIRSISNGKFLSTTSPYDSKRRQLTMADDGEIWVLKRDGNCFRISRKVAPEALYAAKDEFAVDAKRRRIFTWIPKDLSAGQNPPERFLQWEIITVADTNGSVYLRNAQFEEYLSTEFGQSAAFTWRPRDSPNRDVRFLWHIEQLSVVCESSFDLKKMHMELTEGLNRIEALQISTNKRLEELVRSKPRPPNDPTIPTGFVKIHSVFADKYLAVSFNQDLERRNLAVMNNPERWILSRNADHYRITRTQGTEDFFSPLDVFKYDTQRRHVFTWVAGFSHIDRNKWRIVEAPGFPGMVHIKNTHFNEYLMAADFDDRVFTWVPKTAPGNDQHFVWQIEQW